MPDYLIFLSMVGLFALLAMLFKIPIGLSLALSAVAGSILGGHGIALRHLIEGSFGYFDTILIIFCAMIFMKGLEASGILDGITSSLLTTFHRRKAGLLLTLMFLLMFPGMITGSSTAAVLSTGALVAPVLLKLGMSRVRTAALIAMGAILGMIAPPVNILVMIMGAGVDMPYIGLTLPLLILTIPLAVLFSLILGYRHIHTVGAEELRSILPSSPRRTQGLRTAVPPLLVFGWLLGQAAFPRLIPDIGIPAVFLLGSLGCLVCGGKFNPFKVTQDAVRDSMPILAILAGVGMFIQIMTLTGGRGWTVMSFLSLPPALLYLGIAVSMPLFGAVSAYGSASILGVPFILALISKNAVFTSSALSAVASLGDLMPPTALAGMFAAQVVGEPNYFKVLKLCLLPALMLLAAGIGLMLLAGPLDKII
ncbi:MAG: TRAP transporter large permease subunit [Acidobacteria bacterium]|nr:TRAP transporter large permease subunit [Acidobacteriota bacterium]MBU4495185.1 TRAP transporter large permease subunit [Acidobacteriota bacterium]